MVKSDEEEMFVWNVRNSPVVSAHAEEEGRVSSTEQHGDTSDRAARSCDWTRRASAHFKVQKHQAKRHTGKDRQEDVCVCVCVSVTVETAAVSA